MYYHFEILNDKPDNISCKSIHFIRESHDSSTNDRCVTYERVWRPNTHTECNHCKKNTITSSIQSYNEMKHVLISVGPLANRSGYNRT